METLTKDKIINLSEGFDRVGRMIKISGENHKIFRIISPPYKEFFEALLKSRRLEPLFDQFLVKTSISHDYQGELGELILEHRLIPEINYLYEWSREMTKDAGVFLLDAALSLMELGLFIKDTHAFNLTYSRGKWHFFDYGSIVQNPNKISKVWVAHFFHNFGLPVNYFQISSGKKYREFAVRYLNRPFNSWRFFYFSFLTHPIHTIISLVRYWNFVWKSSLVHNAQEQRSFILELREYILGLKIKYPKTPWGGYAAGQPEKLDHPGTWNTKMRSLAELTKTLEATTLLDVGGNTGFCGKLVKLVNKNVKTVTLTDYDEVACDLAYKTESQIDNVYVSDLRHISKDTKVFWKRGKKTVYPNFASRNRADLVMALALVHHLVYFQKMSLVEFVTNLESCCKRWFIVEFVSNEDFHVKKWFKKGLKKLDNYHFEAIKTALEKKFKIISILPSGEANEDRQLILCERRS